MIKLVDDWKRAHTWISTQAMVLVNAFLLTWASIPAKFQESLPIGWVIGIASTILAAGTVGRLVDQKKPDAP